jgi:hypothetical protein
MSSRSRVSGSCIGAIPVSRSTVATHIVLEPDMGGYSVGSMMMAPATQSGRFGGTMRLTWRATLPRGSQRRNRRIWSQLHSKARIMSKTASPGGGRTPPTITSPISPSAWQPTTAI